MRLPLLAASLALTLATPALAQKGGWHRVEEADFTAEFPGEPKHETASAQSEIGPSVTATWDWSTGDESVYFSVTYTQYARDTLSTAKPREVLDKARDASLASTQSKQKSSKAITVLVAGKQCPGLEYEALTPEDFKLSARLLVVGDRMYQLVNVRAAAQPRDEDFRRFVQAFSVKQVSASLDPDAPVADAPVEAPAAPAGEKRVTGRHPMSPKKKKALGIQ